MKYPFAFTGIVGVTITLMSFTGIIRHDVSEKAYLQLAAQAQFDCVGQVFADTNAKGSCVLISDRCVLSAAHLFVESDLRPDTLEWNGQTIVTYVPYNHRVREVSDLHIVFKGQKVKVVKLWLHPWYQDSRTEGQGDLALLELERAVENVEPAILNTAFNELNAEVVGVGYGASGPADRPDLVGLFHKKIAGENVVDSMGGYTYLGLPTALFCDFDHPTQTRCNQMGSSTPQDLEYTCSGGDSGGGLFRQLNGSWELIGICSGGETDIDQLMQTGYYGQNMKWTRVSVFTQWIEGYLR